MRKTRTNRYISEGAKEEVVTGSNKARRRWSDLSEGLLNVSDDRVVYQVEVVGDVRARRVV